MENFDTISVEISLSKIEDGEIFEKFASEFLSQIIGYEFIPVGGFKDRGIDGLEHIFSPKEHKLYIYQSSIQKNYNSKIKNTIDKLINNDINFERLCFITNQDFKDKDKIIEEVYNQYKIQLQIFDSKWFSNHVNNSEGTKNVFGKFLRDYFHEYNLPGKVYIVNDYIKDPRLYVFLNQQWDLKRGNLDLHSILADTLILYCLEGTDPDEGLFKTKDELRDKITVELNSFNFKVLYPIIEKRLNIISKKPGKQINYHPGKGYCLPYETRKKIIEKNLQDTYLVDQFKIQTEKDFNIFLKDLNLKIINGFSLIEKTLNQIFYQQGLDFSNFIINRGNKDIIEKNLFETIDKVVEDSNEEPKNKELVKDVIIRTIRKIVYSGTYEQNQFLMKLSNTYMMMFMLQCDPKVCEYFKTTAAKLHVYVCTSIIIPALSEYFLSEVNRRHWNLLIGAKEAGVTLIINETILSELAAHFMYIKKVYHEQYELNEEVYASGEEQIQYINEIMIRAYYYSKLKGKVKNFQDFISTFVDPYLRNINSELLEWLKTQFNIKFIGDKSLGIEIDNEDFEKIYEELKELKSDDTKAANKVKIMLTIQKIREKNNETDEPGIFGYKTWWLSKDINTQKAVNRIFKNKYINSCYMRPDFLYNYISLAPNPSQIKEVYSKLFPTLLGVNISYHLKKDVTDIVNRLIMEHKDINPARMSAIVKGLSEKIKTEPSIATKLFIEGYFRSETKK